MRQCNRQASWSLPFQLSCAWKVTCWTFSISSETENLQSVTAVEVLTHLSYSQIKSIEIFAPNLEYFGFVGSRIELSVNYAPHLLDVFVGGIYFSPMSYLFCPLSSYLSQLQCLKLDICHCNYVSTLNSFAISFMYVYSVLCNVIFISSLLFFRVNWNTLNWSESCCICCWKPPWLNLYNRSDTCFT